MIGLLLKNVLYKKRKEPQLFRSLWFFSILCFSPCVSRLIHNIILPYYFSLSRIVKSIYSEQSFYFSILLFLLSGIRIINLKYLLISNIHIVIIINSIIITAREAIIAEKEEPITPTINQAISTGNPICNAIIINEFFP